jgi:hypothetical protein
MRMLKVLFETFNIKIDPDEVERAWIQAKDALPRLANAVDEMNKRQARVEIKIDEILARQKITPLSAVDETIQQMERTNAA